MNIIEINKNIDDAFKKSYDYRKFYGRFIYWLKRLQIHYDETIDTLECRYDFEILENLILFNLYTKEKLDILIKKHYNNL